MVASVWLLTAARIRHATSARCLIVGIIAIVVLGQFAGLHFSRTFWVLFIWAYVIVASLLPVWILLQPRDYLSSFLLYGMMVKALGYGAERMTLEVRETNQVAQSLYYSFDFTKEGFRKRYYEDTGEGAYLQ